MVITLAGLLLLAALICWSLGAAGVVARVNWTPLGLLFAGLAYAASAYLK